MKKLSPTEGNMQLIVGKINEIIDVIDNLIARIEKVEKVKKSGSKKRGKIIEVKENAKN